MRRFVLAGLVICLVPKLALASIVQYNDQASFAAAAPGATQFNFSGPQSNAIASYSQGPATFTFPDGYLYNDDFYGAGIRYIGIGSGALTITLSSPAYDFGLTLGTFGGTTPVKFSINDVPFTTVTSAGAQPATSYVGFVDTVPITSLTLATSNGYEIDIINFATSAKYAVPMPEPASLLLLGVGGLAATVLRRRTTA